MNPRLLTARFAVLVACLVLLRPATQAADEPAAKPKTQRVTLKLRPDDPGGGFERTIELVHIPAGTIVLKRPDGKDQEHKVKPIWMAKYETLWDDYDVFWLVLDLPEQQRLKVKGDHSTRKSGQWERPEPPYTPPDGGFGHSGYPASCIHFQAAVKYCTWLSKVTGKKFRLPTEAEWEFACRAGGPPIKLDAKSLDEFAWFADNSDDQPHPAGKKQPNAWGLYDMLGNVGEYVICDPKDAKGVIAGGAWSDQAKDVHGGAREPYSPEWQKNDPEIPQGTSWLDYDSTHRIGFRVVMEE